ncbi:MAG: cysteine-rich KTR domain-containing protein [Pygmaiobacter sp.]|nr:cysteine-rich KTR domain-containing protein [Pygmaiobacter sp.]
MNKDGRYIRCPECGEKTDVKVYEDTTLLHFPLVCPHCKKEFIINVIQFKMTVDKEIDN